MKKSDIKSVKDCQSSLCNLRNRKHLTHSAERRRSPYKAICHKAVRTGRRGLATRVLEKWTSGPAERETGWTREKSNTCLP